MPALARDRIRSTIAAALESAQTAGALPRLPAAEIGVERTSRPEHGDYASSLPLRLAGAAGRSPMEIAEAIAARIERGEMIETVEVARPGFLNVRLAAAWKAEQTESILAAGAEWGNVDSGHGRRVQVEFVSANPTGPLQVGNGRGAVLGDILANVLAAAGYRVEREYYINDTGAQIRSFAATLTARYQQALGHKAEIPADGYPGAYMVELANQIAAEAGDSLLPPEGESPSPPESGAPWDALTERGLHLMVERIRSDLALLGVEYDTWISERTLYQADETHQSAYDAASAQLHAGGHIIEKEGATWLASRAHSDDKDSVLVRRTGEPTYFASDIAYHYDKFVRRGFERVIDVWGADHQGHVSRMKAAAEATGAPPGGLDIVLYQLVNLKRGNERVRMSKRTGEIVTLRELLDDVGRDVARFFLLQRSADAQMDFDLELATNQDPKQNPVYYVQYAHARCAGILATAAEAGIEADGDVQQLRDPSEQALISEMLHLPELVEAMAESLEPHHLTIYAYALAQRFTQFYSACRVVDPEQRERSAARLKLTRAAQSVLARTLGLLGVAAPDTM